MSDEYLWDKSGEPDPEIQRLEEILGTLRYQSRPLQLPDEVRPVRHRRYFSLWAIAAALIVAFFVGIVWLASQRKAEQRQAKSETHSIPAITPEPKSPSPAPPKMVTPSFKNPGHENVAVNRRAPRSRTNAPNKEAIIAKEQLITALRLASEKLSLVQRKTQGPAAPNQIRNQHKVG